MALSITFVEQQIALRPWSSGDARFTAPLSDLERRAAITRSLFAAAQKPILSASQMQLRAYIEELCPNAQGAECIFPALAVLKIEALARIHLLRSPEKSMQYAAVEALVFTELFVATGKIKALIVVKENIPRWDALTSAVKPLEKFKQCLEDPENHLTILLQPLSFCLQTSTRSCIDIDFKFLHRCLYAAQVAVDYVEFKLKESFQKSLKALPKKEQESALDNLHSLIRTNLQQFQRSLVECSAILKKPSSSSKQKKTALLHAQEAHHKFIEVLIDEVKKVPEKYHPDHVGLVYDMYQPLLSLNDQIEAIFEGNCSKLIQFHQTAQSNLEKFETVIPFSYKNMHISRILILVNEILECAESITLDNYPGLKNEFIVLSCLILQIGVDQKNFVCIPKLFETIQAIAQKLNSSTEKAGQRLVALMDLFTIFVNQDHYQLLFVSIGDNRNISARELQFFGDLLKRLYWVTSHFEPCFYNIPVIDDPYCIQTMHRFLALGRDLHALYLYIHKKFEGERVDLKAIIIEYFYLAQQIEDKLNALEIEIEALSNSTLASDIWRYSVSLAKSLFFFPYQITAALTAYAREELLIAEGGKKQEKKKPVFGLITFHQDSGPAPQSTVEEKTVLQKVHEQMQHVSTLDAAALQAPIIQRHYLLILYEILYENIIQWQPALVAEEALSKCALLIEQILKIHLNANDCFDEALRSEHDFLKLLANLRFISLAPEEKALLQQLDGMNANLTEEYRTPAILQELSELMHLYQCFDSRPMTFFDEKMLTERFGIKSTGEWMACTERAIADQIVAVKKIIQETLQLAHKWLMPLGSPEGAATTLIEGKLERPDQALIAAFQDKVDALEQKTILLLGKGKGELPERHKYYLFRLKEQLDHLRRALKYPFTNCDRTYKTILATTIAKTLENVELAALMTYPIHDEEGKHIFYSYTKVGRRKKVVHSHQLKYFYDLLASHLHFKKQRGPIDRFQYHLKIGARYPTFQDELFEGPLPLLLNEGSKIMDMAIKLIEACLIH